MSLSGSINFQTSGIGSGEFARIVGAMLDSCWSVNDGGKISFMIADYEWLDAALSEEKEVMQKVCTSIDNGSPSGINLLWQESGIGGSFLYVSPQEILFSLIVRPLIMLSPKVIDFSWYLQKLEPVFGTIYIQRVICTHEY